MPGGEHASKPYAWAGRFHLFHHIEKDLAELEQEIHRVLHTEDPLLWEVSTHLLRAGGKRLRPALLLTCAGFHRYDLRKLFPVAAAVELIHMATLVHDDVVDGSLVRRGLPTVNARWSQQVSILLGDYLFARAFCLLSSEGDNFVVNTMAGVVLDMSRGEIEQTSKCYWLELTEEDYFSCIGKKTAIFIAECCALGAYLSGAPAGETKALREYGYCIGMGFQIIDDLLDLTASEGKLGKPVGSDLRSGVLTLPVIHALRHSPGKERLREIISRRTMGEEEIQQVREILLRAGSLEYTYDVASRMIGAARDWLQMLPPVPARSALEEIADFIVRREF